MNNTSQLQLNIHNELILDINAFISYAVFVNASNSINVV